MELGKVSLILMAFIGILIGTVLIDSIADSISELDDTIVTPNNESITWSGNNTPFTLAHDDIVAGSDVVWNHTTQMVRNTHYTISKTAITFTNTSRYLWDTAALNITYTYEGANYVDNTTSRTLMNVIPIFFVLAILLIGYVMVTKSYSGIF
jgi:hypothetical protein